VVTKFSNQTELAENPSGAADVACTMQQREGILLVDRLSAPDSVA